MVKTTQIPSTIPLTAPVFTQNDSGVIIMSVPLAFPLPMSNALLYTNRWHI